MDTMLWAASDFGPASTPLEVQRYVEGSGAWEVVAASEVDGLPGPSTTSAALAEVG